MKNALFIAASLVAASLSTKAQTNDLPRYRIENVNFTLGMNFTAPASMSLSNFRNIAPNSKIAMDDLSSYNRQDDGIYGS
ncbi:MAG: hypothetical protein V4616_01485, partial [Bacteroidota bacterium]